MGKLNKTPHLSRFVTLTHPPPWSCATCSEGGESGEPQGKLGRLPKNQRLKDAMAQHRNAKPKPKGWLVSVVESVWKDGECVEG